MIGFEKVMESIIVDDETRENLEKLKELDSSDEIVVIDWVFAKADADFKAGNFESISKILGAIDVCEYSTDALITLGTVGRWPENAGAPALGNI